jgi:CheY-like chemotaxis protein
MTTTRDDSVAVIGEDGTLRPNILIVDDRSENLLTMETALRFVDADIVKALSGQEALSLMMRHDFAVVLLDVQMPEMDGFETATLIRDSKNTCHTPIIFVTAINEDEGNLFKGYEAGAVDVLFKPVNPMILQSKVNVFLQIYRQQAELQVARHVQPTSPKVNFWPT